MGSKVWNTENIQKSYFLYIYTTYIQVFETPSLEQLNAIFIFSLSLSHTHTHTHTNTHTYTYIYIYIQFMIRVSNFPFRNGKLDTRIINILSPMNIWNTKQPYLSIIGVWKIKVKPLRSNGPYWKSQIL